MEDALQELLAIRAAAAGHRLTLTGLCWPTPPVGTPAVAVVPGQRPVRRPPGRGGRTAWVERMRPSCEATGSTVSRAERCEASGGRGPWGAPGLAPAAGFAGGPGTLPGPRRGPPGGPRG